MFRWEFFFPLTGTYTVFIPFICFFQILCIVVAIKEPVYWLMCVVVFFYFFCSGLRCHPAPESVNKIKKCVIVKCVRLHNFRWNCIFPLPLFFLVMRLFFTCVYMYIAYLNKLFWVRLKKSLQGISARYLCKVSLQSISARYLCKVSLQGISARYICKVYL